MSLPEALDELLQVRYLSKGSSGRRGVPKGSFSTGNNRQGERCLLKAPFTSEVCRGSGRVKASVEPETVEKTAAGPHPLPQLLLGATFQVKPLPLGHPSSRPSSARSTTSSLPLLLLGDRLLVGPLLRVDSEKGLVVPTIVPQPPGMRALLRRAPHYSGVPPWSGGVECLPCWPMDLSV